MEETETKVEFPAGLEACTCAQDLYDWALRNYSFQAVSVLVECYSLQELEDDFFQDGRLKDVRFLRMLIEEWQYRM